MDETIGQEKLGAPGGRRAVLGALQIAGMRPRRPGQSWAYALAVLATAATLALYLTLSFVHRENPAPIVFLLPIILSAYVGGLGPGLVSTLLSCVGAACFLMPPIYSLRVAATVDQIRLVSLFGSGTLIAALTEALHRARWRAERSYELEAVTLASVGDAVITTDPHGLVTFLNREAERLTGWMNADAAGQPAAAVFRALNQETRQLIEDPVQSVLRSGASVGLGSQTLLRARDGRETPIEDSAAPIRRADGPVYGVVLVFRDVTERRRAERDLQEAAERFRIVADFTYNWEYWRAPDERLVYVSPSCERITGYSREEFLQNPDLLIQIIHIDDRDRVLRHMQDRETTEPCEIEFRIVRRVGEVRWIAHASQPVRDANGQALGRRISNRDITTRKRAEEALRESEHRIRLKLDRILTPEGDIGNLELADIIDAPAIQSLMDDFYALAHIPMSIIDLHGKLLVGVGWQEICTCFHRIHPETRAGCLESDTLLSAGVPAGEFRLYRCKNGMWDVATPILVGGQQLGNIFSGQFFFDDEALDYELFRGQARQFGFDEADYLAALERVPRLSRAAAKTGMAFFTKLSKIVSQLSYGNIKLARTLAQRDALLTSLRESEERFRLAVASADLGTWDFQPASGEFHWSQRCEAILGGACAVPATYVTFLQRLHPDDRQRVDEAIRQALDAAGSGRYELEYRALWPDGTERCVIGAG